nr:immunoglobulin light chain junction region [Macaca mulatta]
DYYCGIWDYSLSVHWVF